jgi:glycerol-3-phosphate acyltransferase PlsX
MKIIIDAFGGDNAPLEIVKGSVLSVKELDVDIILTGKETVIKQIARENNLSLDRIEIVDCDEVITMEDDPLSVRKTKKNSSMALGFKLLNEGKGQAFISCGNSGALCVGATTIAGRIKGIKRTAFAPVLPSESGFFMLLDGGANVDARPEMLYQFAMMGSVYMEKVMKVSNPRVALANVGTEEHKGTDIYRETFQLLRNSELNFVGNVEGRDIPKGICDVVVCDGFTGNLILKTYEGVAITLMKKIKHMFSDSVKGKMAAVLTMKDIKELKAKFDYNKYGGAPILGSAKPVFKAHGDAKAITVKNAVALSMQYVSGNAINEISASLTTGE